MKIELKYFQSLIPQIFIKGLLCARGCAEHWQCKAEQVPALRELIVCMW